MGLFAWALVLFAVGIHWGLPNWMAWAGDARPPHLGEGDLARHPHRLARPLSALHFALLYWTSWPLRVLVDHKVLALDDFAANTLLTYFGRLVSLVMALATLGLVYRVGR